jgi:flagellar protein FlaG
MEVKPASLNTGVAGVDVSATPAQAPPAQKNERAPETSSLSSEQVKQMVKDINVRLGSADISLTFTPYGKENENMAVTVSDKKTGEVIREIPPKELQDLYVRMDELIGIMFNRTV